MGPRRGSNYGTFVAPPGCCVDEAYRDGGNPTNSGHTENAPSFSQPAPTWIEYTISTVGLRLTKQGAEVVILEVHDDVVRVRIASVYRVDGDGQISTQISSLYPVSQSKRLVHTLLLFQPKVMILLSVSYQCAYHTPEYYILLYFEVIS